MRASARNFLSVIVLLTFVLSTSAHCPLHSTTPYYENLEYQPEQDPDNSSSWRLAYILGGVAAIGGITLAVSQNSSGHSGGHHKDKPTVNKHKSNKKISNRSEDRTWNQEKQHKKTKRVISDNESPKDKKNTSKNKGKYPKKDLHDAIQATAENTKSKHKSTSKRGPGGEKGAPGERGPQGERGHTGEKGPAGERGHTGEKGHTGERGHTGEKGHTGERGPAGERGERGERGPSAFADADSGEQLQFIFTVMSGVMTSSQSPLPFLIEPNGHLISSPSVPVFTIVPGESHTIKISDPAFGVYNAGVLFPPGTDVTEDVQILITVVATKGSGFITELAPIILSRNMHIRYYEQPSVLFSYGKGFPN